MAWRRGGKARIVGLTGRADLNRVAVTLLLWDAGTER